MNKRKKRGWIWLVVIAVLILGGFFIWRTLNQKLAAATEMAAAAMQQSYTVARGDMETVIVGNGTLAENDTVPVRIPDGITVDEVYVSAGEAVTAGQVIAKLNEDSVRTEMLDVQKSLKQEDGSYNTPGSYNSLLAPTKCRLKYLSVSEGDDVLTAMAEYGALAIVSADGWMRLDIKTEETLAIGKRMQVVWDGGSVEGTISRKTANGYVVLVPDERAPYQATAKLMDGTREIGSGTLAINMPISVVGYSGTIDKIKYKVNESVPDGREILGLKNASPSISFEIHYASRNLIAKQMVKLIGYASDPCIYAEQDGVITEISLKEGETFGKSNAATNNSVAYTLATGGAVKMNIEVDELDILKVAVGETAEIVLNALPGETLTGKVTAISKIGKKNNSISVFPVEITLDADERLLVGMNGSATILIDRAENVLLVPLAAIMEDENGSFVNVVTADGATARIGITTGRSNEEYAEVTSGLAEGDVITYTLSSDLISFGMMGGSVSVASTDESGSTVVTDVG